MDCPHLCGELLALNPRLVLVIKQERNKLSSALSAFSLNAVLEFYSKCVSVRPHWNNYSLSASTLIGEGKCPLSASHLHIGWIFFSVNTKRVDCEMRGWWTIGYVEVHGTSRWRGYVRVETWGSTARPGGVWSFLGELSVATVRAQLHEGGIMQVSRGGFAKRLSWRNEPWFACATLCVSQRARNLAAVVSGGMSVGLLWLPVQWRTAMRCCTTETFYAWCNSGGKCSRRWLICCLSQYWLLE